MSFVRRAIAAEFVAIAQVAKLYPYVGAASAGKRARSPTPA